MPNMTKIKGTVWKGVIVLHTYALYVGHRLDNLQNLLSKIKERKKNIPNLPTIYTGEEFEGIESILDELKSDLNIEKKEWLELFKYLIRADNELLSPEYLRKYDEPISHVRILIEPIDIALKLDGERDSNLEEKLLQETALYILLHRTGICLATLILMQKKHSKEKGITTAEIIQLKKIPPKILFEGKEIEVKDYLEKIFEELFDLRFSEKPLGRLSTLVFIKNAFRPDYNSEYKSIDEIMKNHIKELVGIHISFSEWESIDINNIEQLNFKNLLPFKNQRFYLGSSGDALYINIEASNDYDPIEDLAIFLSTIHFLNIMWLSLDICNSILNMEVESRINKGKVNIKKLIDIRTKIHEILAEYRDIKIFENEPASTIIEFGKEVLGLNKLHELILIRLDQLDKTISMDYERKINIKLIILTVITIIAEVIAIFKDQILNILFSLLK